MNALDALVEEDVSNTHQEIRRMTIERKDYFDVLVGWEIKSMGAKRGWVTRKNNQKKEKSL